MESKYAGMTVNERLYGSGLIDKFDKYVSEKNVKKVRLVLRAIDITDELSINAILEELGLRD